MKRYTLVAVVTFVMIFCGADMFALTKTSSQSGNWSAASTWGGNPAPLAGDDVIINGGFTVTLDVANAACLSIQLGGSALNTGTGTLSFTSGSQVTVSGAVSIGPFNNNTTAGSLSMASGGTLICEGLTVGRLGTWTAGTGTIVLTVTNTIPSDNNIIFNNLTLSGGTTTLSRNVSVNGNLIINSGAGLDGGANILSVGGDWTNNGTFSGNTGTVTFIKNGNQLVTGTGVNNFNLIKVNLGTSVNNILEVLATNFSAADPFLTLTNGTFKISGTFSFTNSFIAGPIYNIQPGTGLWINNPNVTVTAQAGGVSAKGLLRLSAGTYNIGTSIDNSLDYVAGSVITIDGGALNIAGRLTRNNATATTSYTQSGGSVTVVEQGSTDPVFAGFDLGAVGSTFTMSGGTIVIRNATSAPADYLNVSSVANVTGGTVQIGDANTANAQTIRIQSSRPVGGLLVSNATAQAVKPTAQIITSSLNVVGGISIQAGTTLNAGGLNVSLGGDWSNSGTFAGGNSVTFNGSGAQALTNPAGETFNTLTVNNAVGTLTLNNSLTVNSTFAFTQGTIGVGVNTLTLNSTVTGAGTFTSASTGTVSYNQASDGQSVLAGNYGNLVFSNFNKTLASTGTIGISGAFTPGSAAGHTVTGSTIDFNGTSQTVPAFPYNNLSASGSGTKTASGIMTVTGNFTTSAGVTFSGTTTLNLNGATHTNGGTINTGTLQAGPGATITNNGTITASSALSGAGTLTQGATGTLNIGGSAGIAAINATTAGNTVNYTGASQTVTPMNYHHLTLSGSGAPILTGVGTINGNFILAGSVTPVAATGMSIGGNFTIGTGTSFDAGSFSHSVGGNWNNAGTFNAGTSTFTLNGSGAQTMSGSTFNNLTIANAAGVTMLTDETINGTLTLTSGVLTTGTNKVTLTNNAPGAVVITSGSVNGELVRPVAAGSSGAYLFSNANTSLVPNGSQGAITVSVRSFPNTAPPNVTSGRAVTRYYTITPSGALTATLRLAYLAGEINGIPEADMRLFRYNGTVWVLEGGIPNSVSKYVELAGVSTFSTWTIGDINNPLPIQLASFSGSAQSNGDISLTWVTISETNNYGFTVQRKRSADPDFVDVLNGFVPGHGTTNVPHTYTFIDGAPGTGTWMYRLKSVDLNGAQTYTDPIQIDVLTGVQEVDKPVAYALGQNYPNPFNPSTQIRFDLPFAGQVSLAVYDITGRKIAELASGFQEAGRHSATWNASNQASGVYFAKFTAADGQGSTKFSKVNKLVLMK